jgi:hypothetical protein
MKTIHVWKTPLLLAFLGLTSLGALGYAQEEELSTEEYASESSEAPSEDPTQKIIVEVNTYRTSGDYVRNFEDEDQSSLLSASDDDRNSAFLYTTNELFKAAQETADRFAQGVYDYDAENPHWQMNGEHLNGATVRAIKAGWEPAFNATLTTDRQPPFTGVNEALWRGPVGMTAGEAMGQLVKSPDANAALLKYPAYRMGFGYAANDSHSYWVVLIEAEGSMEEYPENWGLFSEGSLYQPKEGVESTSPAEAYEWVEGGLDNIRNY